MVDKILSSLDSHQCSIGVVKSDSKFDSPYPFSLIYEKSVHLPRVIKMDFKAGL